MYFICIFFHKCCIDWGNQVIVHKEKKKVIKMSKEKKKTLIVCIPLVYFFSPSSGNEVEIDRNCSIMAFECPRISFH